MKLLVLRFDAPLMSFGSPAVDQNRETWAFPPLSMTTGLLANALGLSYEQSSKHAALQSSLRFGVRRDREGELLTDYQTTDLSQPHMRDDRAWTTSGETHSRSGTVATSTHVSTREYWADAMYTLAFGLGPSSPEGLSIEALAEAVQTPARPLFLGRKNCVPASRLYVETLEATSPLQGLAQTPLPPSADDRPAYPVQILLPSKDASPDAPEGFSAQTRRPIDGRKDWDNHVHSGQTWVLNGTISLEKPSSETHE